MQLRCTTCLIFIFCLLVPKVSAVDGRLIVPKVWVVGARINMICQISKAAQRDCASKAGLLAITIYRKDYNQICSVPTRWHGNCLTQSPVSKPDKCWCEEGPGDTINYVYRHWAHPINSNGSWSCDKGCEVAGNVTMFTIDNSAGVNKTTITPTVKCDEHYVARKEYDRDEAVCVCENNREIGTCGPCTTSLYMGGYCTGLEQVPTVIALVVILVLVLTLNLLYFVYVRTRPGKPMTVRRKSMH